MKLGEKYSSVEYFMFQEFQLDWMKIVDFLLVVKFKAYLHFFKAYFTFDFPCLVKKNLHDKGSIYYSSYSARGDVTSFPLLLCCLALRAET